MSQHPIKIVKRSERGRAESNDAQGRRAELSVNEEARVLAATVNEWVREFRQTRLQQYLEIRQQLDWSEDEGEDTGRHIETDPHENDL